MDGSLALQIFLLIDVFIMGLIAAAAIRHAYAHFKPQTHKDPKTLNQNQAVHIPPEIKENLIHKSEAHFQNALNHSINELDHDLKNTIYKLNNQLEKFGNEIIIGGLSHYRTKLDQFCKQLEISMEKNQAEIAKHQSEINEKLAEQQSVLEKELAENIKNQQQIMIQNINTKLSDAVATFLIETMQHNIDLGAQTNYLTKMLEEHKSEFIKEINNEN